MAMVKLVERIVQLEWFQKIEWLADIELWDIARQQKTRKKRAEAKQSDVHFLHDAVIDSHSRDCSAVPRATTAVANGTAADSLSEPSPLFIPAKASGQTDGSVCMGAAVAELDVDGGLPFAQKYSFEPWSMTLRRSAVTFPRNPVCFNH